jgi:beta-glucosidase-like glycosyl hydrolase
VADAWQQHHYVATAEKASALAIKVGKCDIDSGDTYYNNLIIATKVGLCSMADIDAALTRTLKQRFALGLFDDIENQVYWQYNVSEMGSAAAAADSYQASLQSLVLLQNRGVLPLPAGKQLALIGPHANATSDMMMPYPFDPYCPDGTSNCLISPAAALEAENAKAGGKTTVTQGCDLWDNSTAGFADAVAAAKAADVVVLFLGIEVRCCVGWRRGVKEDSSFCHRSSSP